MGIIGSILHAIAPKALPNYAQAFDGDDLFARFAIDRPLRRAHLMAQVLHETGGASLLRESLTFTTAERLLQIFGVGRHSAAITPEEAPGLLRNPESLAERVYGLGNPPKAKELGNLKPGDAYRYRGAGALQTTGGANYRRMSELTGVDFYGSPDLMVDPAHLLLPALHLWQRGNLNAAADADDILTITKTINGGTIGLADRKGWFERVLPLAGGAAPSLDDDSVLWLQKALNALGADPRLAEDGTAGPATGRAVRIFQSGAGLAADGVAGPRTRAALRERLAAAAITL